MSNINDEVSGNSVSISGTTQFNAANSFLFGGYRALGNADMFTGNTLEFSAYPVTVNTVASFEYYNFTLNTATALITANLIGLGNGSGTASTIKVVGIHSGSALNVNDHFILMEATSLIGDGVGLAPIKKEWWEGDHFRDRINRVKHDLNPAIQ